MVHFPPLFSETHEPKVGARNDVTVWWVNCFRMTLWNYWFTCWLLC